MSTSRRRSPCRSATSTTWTGSASIAGIATLRSRIPLRRPAADRDVHDVPLAALDTGSLLELIHRSLATGTAMKWTRVNDLPDFVYFDHSIHVNKGIGCATCHGAVDQMPLTWRENTLYMKWCLDCHRARKTKSARASRSSI